MLVSTKGRYALRVMIDLASHEGDGFIPLKDIAERQCLSQKYLEAIFKPLSDIGLVAGMRGKKGGYKLSKDPSDITILEVLKITEGGLEPVSCMKKESTCINNEFCALSTLWGGLHQTINNYLSSYTITNLVENNKLNFENDLTFLSI